MALIGRVGMESQLERTGWEEGMRYALVLERCNGTSGRSVRADLELG
jgi:hypothetical protein